MFPTGKDLDSRHTSEFVHITNTNKQFWLGQKNIAKYLLAIGIPPYIDPTGKCHSQVCTQ